MASKKPSKQVRAWYQAYCEECEKHDETPLPLRAWAAIESERYENTRKGKALVRFLLGW